MDSDYTIPDPEGGYFSIAHWDYYTDETILINLLGMGSPTYPVPSRDVFYTWARNESIWGPHPGSQLERYALYLLFRPSLD